mgnify:FL=1
MDSEHRRLVERLLDENTSGDGSFRYVEGTLGGNHVILTQCGIGKVSAAVGASELIRRFLRTASSAPVWRAALMLA